MGADKGREIDCKNLLYSVWDSNRTTIRKTTRTTQVNFIHISQTKIKCDDDGQHQEILGPYRLLLSLHYLNTVSFFPFLLLLVLLTCFDTNANEFRSCLSHFYLTSFHHLVSSHSVLILKLIRESEKYSVSNNSLEFNQSMLQDLGERRRFL